MGIKCTLLAHSPRVPREDITAQPEAGSEAAQRYLDNRWPGEWEFDRTSTLDEGLNPREGLWIGIWGETVVLAGDKVYELVHDEPVDGEWALLVMSTVDACSYRTPPSHGGRVVNLSDQSTLEDKRAALSGTLLPFEQPYARGEHDEAPEDYGNGPEEYGFHTLELGNSAILWMFGTIGETAPVDEVSSSITPIYPEEIPFHCFQPAEEPDPIPMVAAAPVKKGFFARLLGR